MTTTEEGVIAEGTKVRLRNKRISDAGRDYAWRRDTALVRYDAARPTSLNYDEFVSNFRSELQNPQPFRRTFAVENQDGVHIGNAMYYNIDLRRREAELGITIGDTASWGEGCGTEAVELLVDYVFTTTTLTRIYLHTLDWNERAQRCFLRAGFRECGTTRRGEHRFRLMEIRREWLWDRDYQARAIPHPS